MATLQASLKHPFYSSFYSKERESRIEVSILDFHDFKSVESVYTRLVEHLKTVESGSCPLLFYIHLDLTLPTPNLIKTLVDFSTKPQICPKSASTPFSQGMHNLFGHSLQ